MCHHIIYFIIVGLLKVLEFDIMEFSSFYVAIAIISCKQSQSNLINCAGLTITHLNSVRSFK